MELEQQDMKSMNISVEKHAEMVCYSIMAYNPKIMVVMMGTIFLGMDATATDLSRMVRNVPNWPVKRAIVYQHVEMVIPTTLFPKSNLS
jgi:hypothetical protein